MRSHSVRAIVNSPSVGAPNVKPVCAAFSMAATTRGSLHHGDERRLFVKLGDGLELTLQDDDPVVDLSVDGGQATLTIDRDGTITLKGSSDLTIEAGGSMTIKAGGTLDIQGSTVNIN
jgi:hypothetical protein